MRSAEVQRNTLETRIRVKVDLDGSGKSQLATGVGFFDHMLDQIARHGMLDLEVEAQGDLHIDAHHTVEDVGITLGQALAKALGDKKGMRRYGHAYVPLDEALSRVVVDLSGRPGLFFNVDFVRGTIGEFDVDLVREFFQGLVNHAQITRTSTTCAATTPTIRPRPCSRPSAARCAWRSMPTRARPVSSPRPRAVSDSCAMTTVAVVDYGMGNLRSVAKAIEHVAPQASVLVTADPAQVAAADRVVVPGQGAMPDCMRELDGARPAPGGDRRGGEQAFPRHLHRPADAVRAQRGGRRARPRRASPGGCASFPHEAMVGADGSRLKVPHMGWNEVEQHGDTGPHAMWNGIANGSRFYFVHSYYVEPAQPDVIAGSTVYGIPFTSAVARDNIFAVQFHPEKSAESGLRLLGNFMSWNP